MDLYEPSLKSPIDVDYRQKTKASANGGSCMGRKCILASIALTFGLIGAAVCLLYTRPSSTSAPNW